MRKEAEEVIATEKGHCSSDCAQDPCSFLIWHHLLMPTPPLQSLIEYNLDISEIIIFSFFFQTVFIGH
jgi:hypothetical protein